MENNRFHSASFRKALSPWLFMLPGIIFTVWLRYYPIIKSFYMSLFSYDAVNPPGHFAGFQNYINLFTAAYYWDAWKNTFIFLILQLVLVFWVPLVQAIFLNELKRFQKTFSTIYLITALIPISVSVILWKWIWNPDFGLANQIVKAFGLPQQMWLSNPALTKFCIIFPGFVGGGVGVLLFLSAINGISEDVLEASQLDGCSGWQRIRHIILPNIRFIIIIQLVLAVISSMQILDAPYQFAAGGPSGASTSMGVYIYSTFYTDLDYGKATAASCILFLVIAVLTFLQLRMDQSEAE